MQLLDVNNPNQVSSPKMLDIFLGVPQNHLLIFTGIALPEWNSQSNLDREQVIINLEQPITVTALVSYTATVGLASIGNSDSDFTFATDDVAISLDQNGQLQLISNIAVQGEPSILHRFSYQANVIVDVDEPLISGTISWTQETASIAPMNRMDNLFAVNAFIQTPPPPGGGFGGTQVVVIGTVTSVPVLQNGMYSVPYVILNPPLNTALYVGITAQSGAFNPQNNGYLYFQQISGPSPITLTPQHLKETDVNFEMFYEAPPR